MRYTEIEEDKIRNQIKLLTEQGMDTEQLGLSEVLKIGQVYKDHGLTPLYLYDEIREGLIIRIAETQDPKKLH